MNLKPTAEESDKVYLAPHEYRFVTDFAKGFDERVWLAIRIMGDSGPRIGKTSKIKRNDVYIPDAEEIKIAVVDIRDSKDTTADDQDSDPHRTSYIPRSLYQDIEKYCQSNRIGGNDELFDIGKDHLQDLINDQLAEALVEETGNDDWANITTHDFRRFFATQRLRREGLDDGIVKFMGDWSSDKAISPYLDEPTVHDIQNEIAKSGIAEIDLPHPENRHGEIEEIHNRLDNIEKALGIRECVDELSSLTREDIESIKELANSKKGSLRDLLDEHQASMDEFTDSEENTDRVNISLNPVKPIWLSYSKFIDSVINNAGPPIKRWWDDHVGVFPNDVLKPSTPVAAISGIVFGTFALALFGLVLRSNGIVIDPWTGTYSADSQSVVALGITTYIYHLELQTQTESE
jgi:hypothetical protein